MENSVELPKDAAGREIPLDTEEIFDETGDKLRVMHVAYDPYRHGYGFVVCKDGSNEFLCAEYVYLEKPALSDSWEKLLDDLDNTAKKASSSIFIATPCAWFSGGNRKCADCPADEPPEDTCGVKLIKDIAARIRKLKGED